LKLKKKYIKKNKKKTKQKYFILDLKIMQGNRTRREKEREESNS